MQERVKRDLKKKKDHQEERGKAKDVRKAVDQRFQREGGWVLGQMLNKIKGNEHELKSPNLVRNRHRKSKSTISVEWAFLFA